MLSSLSMELERSRRHQRTLEIIMKYAAGVPVDEIIDHYSCSSNTVLRYARAAGLPKRPKGVGAEIRAGVISMYRAGNPIKTIADFYGVSQAYVSKTATEENINRYATVPSDR